MTHKLLLADDSVTIQRVIELTFAGEDMQVLTAGDGEQAIAKVEAERPDIVLADIGMPKRSGYEVASFIRSQPQLAHVPVLLLAGAFEPVDEARAQASGCDGVLVKPFEPQHVIARVRELLRRAKGSPEHTVADEGRSVERPAPPGLEEPPRRDAPTDAIEGFDADEFAEAFGARTPPTSGGHVEPGRAVSDSSLDDYFDRLDAAFAGVGVSPEEPAPPRVHEPEVLPRNDALVMEKDLDWFDTPATVEGIASKHESGSITSEPARGATPPRHGAVRLPATDPDAPWFDRVDATAATSATVAESGSGPLIAEAFSALLAAEQGEPGAIPVRIAVPGGAHPITDDMIDDITARVIQRLGPGVVKDVVSDVVSRVAERLVREEIERIRKRHL